MTIQQNFPVCGEEGMRKVGAALASCLQAGDAVLLYGEMGMGKSVLARAVARAFGVQGAMPSPTFTILQSYEGTLPVKHFDLYRMEDPQEFYESGLDEEMDDQSLCLVEWPEMTDFQPEPRLEIRFSRGAHEEERLLSISSTGFCPQRAFALGESLGRLLPSLSSKIRENGENS